MKCYVCGDEAIKRNGRANLCAQHRRFIQMQKAAKSDKKYIPSLFELEKLVPIDMKCQDCGDQMHWIDNNNRSKGAVLQHYRDGTLGIVCMSCNSKHGLLPGDMYRDIPKYHKLCISCRSIKPLSMFSMRNDAKKQYPMSKCRPCNLKAQQEWRLKNPEKYKQTTKRNNEKKKQDIEKRRAYDRERYRIKKLQERHENITI
jgi:hypothetical protein